MRPLSTAGIVEEAEGWIDVQRNEGGNRFCGNLGSTVADTELNHPSRSKAYVTPWYDGVGVEIPLACGDAMPTTAFGESFGPTLPGASDSIPASVWTAH